MLCVCCVGLGMEDRPHSNDWTQGLHPLIANPVNAFLSALGTGNNHSEIPTPTNTSSTSTPESLPLRVAPSQVHQTTPATVLAPHPAAPAGIAPVTTLKTPVPTPAGPEKFHPTWVFKDYTPIDTKLIDTLWKMHTDTRYDITALDKAWDVLKVQAAKNEQHAIQDIEMLDQIRRAFEEHQIQHLRSLNIKRLQSNLVTKLQEKQTLEAQIKPGMYNARINYFTNQKIQLKDNEIAGLRAEINRVKDLKTNYKDSEHIPQRPKPTASKLLGLFVSPTLQRQY